MSKAQPATQRETSPEYDGPASPYPRGNYYSSVDESYDPNRETQDQSTHEHPVEFGEEKRRKNRWIAKSVLKEGATIVCPIALHDDPSHPWSLHDVNTAVELTDPEVYPPSGEGTHIGETKIQKKAPSNRRWRVNEQHGYVVFGGVIQDRPKTQFLEVVDEMIQAVEYRFLDEQVKKAQALAYSMKTEGDKKDVEIMERVIDLLIDFRDESSSNS